MHPAQAKQKTSRVANLWLPWVSIAGHISPDDQVKLPLAAVPSPPLPFALGVPSGPVNTLDQVFADPQVRARGLRAPMAYPGAKGGAVDLIGNPIKLSATPVDYRLPPPRLGAHTQDVLSELLDMDTSEVERLRARGVV